MRFNPTTFYSQYRAIFGPLTQGQVSGLNFLLHKIESDSWESVSQVAYFLATIKWESTNTFQPIQEMRARVGTRLRNQQDRYWLSGFYGRGYVQITWRANYQQFGIESNPDKALEPETAYEIASRGMREGLFTGRPLSEFVNGEVDYVEARKVVNGLDRAGEIASIAVKFELILRRSLENKEPENATL